MLLKELSRNNTAHPPLNLQCKNDAQLSLQKCTFQMHKHNSEAIALLSGSLPVHLVSVVVPRLCLVSVVPRSCPSSRTNHNVFSKPTIVPAIDCDKGNSEIAM